MGDAANIRFQCPHCSKGLRVAAKLAGRRVKCPNLACGQPIEIPLPLDDEPVPPSPPRPRPSGRLPGKLPANGGESAAARSAPRARRPRWPWYAGGGVAALCVVAGVVLAIAMSGKDRTNASGALGEPNGVSGDVNKKEQEPLPAGGLTEEKLLGEWEGKFEGGSINFTFYPKKDQKLVAGVVLKIGGSVTVSAVGYEIDGKTNEVKFPFLTKPAVAKPTNDGALLFSGGQFTFGLNTYTVPETRIARIKPGAAAGEPKTGDPEPPRLSPKLPGAAGERVVYPGPPVNPWAVYLSDAEGLPKGGPKAPWSQVLPSGTKKLQVGVVFSGEPNRVDVSVRVRSGSGSIDLADLKQEWILLNSTYVRQVYIAPKSGAFPDGPYQAEVFSSGTKVAVLNWSVGNKPDGDKTTPPDKGAGEVDPKDLPRDGPGDPALTYGVVNKNTAKHRGKRVTWAFVPCSTDGKRMMCALDMKEAMGPRHAGIYVVEFPSQEEAGRAFRSAAFKAGSTITGTIAGEVEQFLVVRGPGGEPQKDIPKVTVPLLVHPNYALEKGEGGAGTKGKE